MSKHYKPYSPEQPYLLPVCPQDWMPSDHLAYMVHDLISELDLSAIEYRNYNETRGASAFDPLMMVSILVYAWANNIFSSRKIANLCISDIGGRYLAASYQPDFRTINSFRMKNGEPLEKLFQQSVHLCQKAGMVSLGQIAVDGTKLSANASKHKAMSYGRMVEKEAQLNMEIAEYQRRCREVDAEEDAQFGKNAGGPSLPEELKYRETRLARIREARKALEKEAQEAAEIKKKDQSERQKDTRKPPRGRRAKATDEAKPKDKAQRNFTDPESKIMKSGTGEYVQGYNGQAAVDRDYQVIVACDLTDQAADAPHLQPMMKQVTANTGVTPTAVSADAGYFSVSNVSAQLDANIQPYIPPSRIKHSDKGALADVVTNDDTLSLADWMRLVLSTEEGSTEYGWRKKTVEPVFGQIKGCPGSPGMRQFLRRGLKKARQEWCWICAVHNFKKLFRYRLAEMSAAQAW